MKYLIILVGLIFSTLSFASTFAELDDKELLPANDGFYGCYIYDNQKIIGAMNRDGLYFDKQHFTRISQADLFELGENKAKTAIYGNTKTNLTFYRTKKATFDDGVIHYSVKMTYQKTNSKPKTYQFLVECGA